MTERKNRETRLEEMNNRIELALDHTGSIIFEIDLESDEVSRTGAYEKFFGMPPDEVKTSEQHVDRAVHPDDRAAFREFYRALASGERTSGTLEYRTNPDFADARWIRDNVHRIEEEKRLLGLAVDVTERRNREERLREAKREAEEAARLKSTMLANMSHEIRTPLTAINGFTEILTEEVSGEAEMMAERAHQGGQRLMKTLNSVLELSQLEAGTYNLDREQIRLQKTVEGTAQLLVSQAEEKGISLAVACKADPVGAWDDTALNRICENLIGNAIKFTPEGGQVTVRVGKDGEDAILEVEDTGIGISEAALPKIFEAFEQESEGLSREYEGTGLGLSIARRLTEALNGTIEVETEKGDGTCFTVRLPKRPGATENER